MLLQYTLVFIVVQIKGISKSLIRKNVLSTINKYYCSYI